MRRCVALDWVALADVSPAMSAALVAAEDKRFYEHAGVDWTGLVGRGVGQPVARARTAGARAAARR